MHVALFCPCEIPTFKSWTKLAEPNGFLSFSAPTRDKHLFLPDKHGAKSADPAGPHQCASASVFTSSESQLLHRLDEWRKRWCHWGRYKAILIYQEFTKAYSLKSKQQRSWACTHRCAVVLILCWVCGPVCQDVCARWGVNRCGNHLVVRITERWLLCEPLQETRGPQWERQRKLAALLSLSVYCCHGFTSHVQ